MFDVDERRKYMREYYLKNKYKWNIYYDTVVLPKFLEARRIKEEFKRQSFVKKQGNYTIVFD